MIEERMATETKKRVQRGLHGRDYHSLEIFELERDRIFCRIKSVKIAKNEAKRVANVAIDSGDPLHDLWRACNILTEVDRRDPHAHDFSAEALEL